MQTAAALTLSREAKETRSIHGLPTLQLNTLAYCSVYTSVHVAALFSKVISGTGKKREKVRKKKKKFVLKAVKDIKNSATTFMLGIDRHFEGILSKINFGDVDPLTVDVVLVDVITTHRDAFAPRAKKKTS